MAETEGNTVPSSPGQGTESGKAVAEISGDVAPFVDEEVRTPSPVGDNGASNGDFEGDHAKAGSERRELRDSKSTKKKGSKKQDDKYSEEDSRR